MLSCVTRINVESADNKVGSNMPWLVTPLPTQFRVPSWFMFKLCNVINPTLVHKTPGLIMLTSGIWCPTTAISTESTHPPAVFSAVYLILFCPIWSIVIDGELME